MVARVYYQAQEASLLDQVIIATDSDKVFRAMGSYHIPVEMTSKTHHSGTERVAEVAENHDGDIFVNIQGDEPFIDPSMIDDAILPFLKNDTLDMGTVASKSITDEDLGNPDIVKVRINDAGFAEDFFRILSSEKAINNIYKHIGLYVYRKEVLIQFAKMEPSPKEKERDLEQMRALDNGIHIKVVLTDYDSIGINTPEDLKLVEEYYAKASY
jgi:3-deoxy-manno-octulosonate cytidylyltransferase (CMP-KDO synthetase)